MAFIAESTITFEIVERLKGALAAVTDAGPAWWA